MSEFSRWLTKKYPEYFWEQEAPPMQQNPPAQSSAEILLRQRLQKRAGGQGSTPTQQTQDAKAAAERLQQRLQQRQGAGAAGAGANPNASNEVKAGFNNEYSKYLIDCSIKNNDQCSENLGAYIWKMTNKLFEIYNISDEELEYFNKKFGFTKDMVEDWWLNYHAAVYNNYFIIDRRTIMNNILKAKINYLIKYESIKEHLYKIPWFNIKPEILNYTLKNNNCISENLIRCSDDKNYSDYLKHYTKKELDIVSTKFSALFDRLGYVKYDKNCLN